MDKFDKTNEALASWLVGEFYFPDYTPAELVDIMYVGAEKEGFKFSVSNKFAVELVKGFEGLCMRNTKFSF